MSGLTYLKDVLFLPDIEYQRMCVIFVPDMFNFHYFAHLQQVVVLEAHTSPIKTRFGSSMSYPAPSPMKDCNTRASHFLGL